VTRLIVLSDVHGNLAALEAVRKALRAEKPDLVAIAGDLALNGPDPAGTIDLLQKMESEGAAIVSGNTDIAVATRLRGSVPCGRRRPGTFRRRQWRNESATSGWPGSAASQRSAGCAPTTGR
jgi:predicted phosphodiesterase